MFNFWKKWLLNAPIKNKFYPMQAILYALILCFAFLSIASVYNINSQSKKIYTESFVKVELLNAIEKKMYACRVLGRDILFEPELLERTIMYTDYLQKFKALDTSMNEFAKMLNEEELAKFNIIIQEKEKYKEYMILSANIYMDSQKYAEALEALQAVTPIANSFFRSIQAIHDKEVIVMNTALEENQKRSDLFFSFVLIASIVIVVLIYFVINYSVTIYITHLSEISSFISKIAETGNMRMSISKKYLTKDELGQIISVVEKLKNMLQEYSFKDKLTDGLNSTAYHSELYEYFENKENAKKVKEFTFIIFDMNNLKIINDNFGHLVGDRTLIEAHSILVDAFSKYGKIFRVGGDEFIAILNTTNPEEVEERFAYMKEQIADINYGRSYNFDIAAGYGIFKGVSKASFDSFYSTVDKEMYKNKILIKTNKNNTISQAKEERIQARIDEVQK